MRTAQLGYISAVLALIGCALLVFVAAQTVAGNAPRFSLMELDDVPIDNYIPARPADLWFENGCENFRWNRGIMECGDGQ
eukprot:CAMPEP_0177723336 /NCGR_PEP_ID=MMETSP0484_2-20121128/18158_1 /TAXON_ID=354590 /ORGANISM="Rhodomonas lens, Strain RHODO" /LENGTH=79 /DNA_ID=CAMNT_0019235765 /DNA_START=49 /DNA_END=288 /DNA_ORIENTATION=-